MNERANTAAHACCRTESTSSSGAEPLRPWSREENLWLRMLKERDTRLRTCDWSFLDTRLGRTRREVRRQLHKLGLSNYGRRYTVDEAFFDDWTPESAWVLGLLLSAGHLSRGQATLHFSSVDRELVEKLCRCLRATHTIYVSMGGAGHIGEKPLHVVDINRRRLRASIDALIGGRLKSERTRVPDVPREHLRHFVRGYFEGDGSIFVDEPRSNLHVQISGLTAFIENLRDRLVRAGAIHHIALRRCPQAKNTSTLHLNGARAFHLAHFMYHGVPLALVLERKRATFVRTREWRRARGLLPENTNAN